LNKKHERTTKMNELLQIIIAFISGGVIWEGFKFFYPDLKRPIISRIHAKRTLYKNIDPIIKSASELYGKLESLAKEDFSTFIKPVNSNSLNPEHNKKYVLYLFAQFWAQLEYLRLESQYTSLSNIKSGKQLLRFIETIESRKYRILDRSVQRIIGESLIINKEQKFKVMTLKEFFDELNNHESTLSKWIKDLESIFDNVQDKEQRQIILRFGVIVALFIDHFDPKHKTVRRRKVYKNKLSVKSKRMIKNNLLNYYLEFIKDKTRYY